MVFGDQGIPPKYDILSLVAAQGDAVLLFIQNILPGYRDLPALLSHNQQDLLVRWRIKPQDVSRIRLALEEQFFPLEDLILAALRKTPAMIQFFHMDRQIFL